MPESRQPTPQEIQMAVIAALEAIQSEIGFLVDVLKYPTEAAGKGVRPPIVYPQPGKMCTELRRVVNAPEGPEIGPQPGTRGGSPT